MSQVNPQSLVKPQQTSGTSSGFKTPRSTATSASRNRVVRQNLLFKSPLRTCVEPTFAQIPLTPQNIQDDIKHLTEHEQKLDAEIEQLYALGYREEELKIHMNMMHDYNEIKDVGQMILGRIAMSEGRTTRDLYQRYGLSLDD